ncbi:MAG: saccharopine dehydrogenase NADP-binding domain-containing protein [Ignavibacteriales bacterium]|nr:saccharopine dehydrogenase NADP-binding domain-containing protein [Ignavibacteriales bacterium]
MNFLVFGSGLMGSALAYDLAHSSGVKSVTLADTDERRAVEAASRIGSKLVHPERLDVEYYDDVIESLRGHDCAIGAVSYRFNHMLSKACIEAGAHYCDLGGNQEVVDRQRALHAQALERGVTIVPNCGLAPGFANVLAARGAEQFESVEAIHIRVGGLPQHPKPPFNYQLVFSVEGLINEYTGESVVLRDFKKTTVPTLTELESIEFPPPFGTLEAFHTSGGTSLLPEIFEGTVRTLDYKTIRYKGHCERFKSLLDLGFASSEPISVGTNVMTAREMFHELLKRKLSGSDPDVVLLRATIRGTQNGRERSLVFSLIDSFDKNANISAMMRTTSFPTSVIAQFLVNGTIQQRGVLTPEQCVPLRPLIDELRQRAFDIREEWK